MRFPLALLAASSILGCAAAAPPVAVSPQAAVVLPPVSAVPMASAAPTQDPFRIPFPLREEPLIRVQSLEGVTAALAPAPSGLPPAPTECSAFVTRAEDPVARCHNSSPREGLKRLADALDRVEPRARDAALQAVEGCEDLPRGLVRALRAELSPTECADVIVEPALKDPATTGAARTAMLGLALAARVARTSKAPPALPKGPLDKAQAEAYAKELVPWMKEQLVAIDAVSRAAIALPYYAKGLVAIEAGIAEMRVVEAVRAAPIPEAYRSDREWQDVYYASLDEQLEPFKAVARDAALAGLGMFAFLGSLDDPRVLRARTLLTGLYGGRRVDALDRLLLPALPTPSAPSLEARLAATLPTFYASQLVAGAAAEDPEVLRHFAERGVSFAHRAALSAKADPSAEVRRLFARARVRLGALYLRAIDFDQAIQLLAADTKPSSAADARLLLALSLALRTGPESVASLVQRAPGVLGPYDVSALDALARTAPTSAEGVRAAFDAALLCAVAPPSSADGAYFRNVAARWSDVASRLPEAALRDFAKDQATAAEATAAALH